MGKNKRGKYWKKKKEDTRQECQKRVFTKAGGGRKKVGYQRARLHRSLLRHAVGGIKGDVYESYDMGESGRTCAGFSSAWKASTVTVSSKKRGTLQAPTAMCSTVALNYMKNLGVFLSRLRNEHQACTKKYLEGEKDIYSKYQIPNTSNKVKSVEADRIWKKNALVYRASYSPLRCCWG